MSRKLDAAIAEALGKTIYKLKHGVAYEKLPALQYSTDGNAMLELAKEMRERGFDYQISTVTGCRGLKESKEIEVVFYKNSNEMATGWRSGKEMPLVFARQAYWALTGEEWEDE